MHYREILFTPRCSPRAWKFPRSGQLFSTTYELRGVKIALFSDFGLFSTYKSPKTYLPVTSLQPRGLHRRIIPIFPSGSRRSKEVPSRTGDFLRLLLVGVLGTPELAQIFATHNATILLASDLDQRCLKTCNSEDECTFSPNIFASTPKITPKPHFGGPFNAKPITQRALHQLHVNGATMLKLYSYIGTSKYFVIVVSGVQLTIA